MKHIVLYALMFTTGCATAHVQTFDIYHHLASGGVKKTVTSTKAASKLTSTTTITVPLSQTPFEKERMHGAATYRLGRGLDGSEFKTFNVVYRYDEALRFSIQVSKRTPPVISTTVSQDFKVADFNVGDLHSKDTTERIICMFGIGFKLIGYSVTFPDAWNLTIRGRALRRSRSGGCVRPHKYQIPV